MEKTIRLNAEQAKALYEKDTELRDTLLHKFSDEELGIKSKPFTWYHLKEVSGSFVRGMDSYVTNIDSHCAEDPNRNIAPTKKDAKSIRAKSMLLQLAKHYNDGQTEEEWIDWEDSAQEKYCLLYNNSRNRYEFHSAKLIQMPIIHFKRREDLEKCFDDNPELWKEYFKE